MSAYIVEKWISESNFNEFRDSLVEINWWTQIDVFLPPNPSQYLFVSHSFLVLLFMIASVCSRVHHNVCTQSCYNSRYFIFLIGLLLVLWFFFGWHFMLLQYPSVVLFIFVMKIVQQNFPFHAVKAAIQSFTVKS